MYAPLFYRSALCENLYLINRSEVPPSGGALNPNLVFEIDSSVQAVLALSKTLFFSMILENV